MPIDRPSLIIAMAETQNASEAQRRYDLLDKLLHPTSMDKAELELWDAWWVSPDQKKKMGDPDLHS